MQTTKTAVVAVGGNSLITDASHLDVEYQWDAVRASMQTVATLIQDGWNVVVTHGNGPQVGFILRRNELAWAAEQVHTTPIDLIIGDTQGAIGYMIQQALTNSLRTLGMNKSVITLVTQTLVDPDDPAFQNPSKPIGRFMDETTARQFEAEGWQIMEDAGRGWRRLIASPKPLDIIEMGVVRAMLQAGYVVVAAGGGGIPVYRNERGELRSLEAVIDKDRASALLATLIKADLFLISTGVPKVAINFNTSQQQNLDQMTLAKAKNYLAAGQFGRGSMQPKIEAVIDFLEQGGPQALITDPPNLKAAMEGKNGTWITPT